MGVDDAESIIAPSLFSVNTGVAHWQERKNDERLQEPLTTLDAKRALTYGKNFQKLVPTYLGRYKIEFKGNIYIFAEDQKTIITVYPKNEVENETEKKMKSLEEDVKGL